MELFVLEVAIFFIILVVLVELGRAIWAIWLRFHRKDSRLRQQLRDQLEEDYRAWMNRR